MTSQAHPMELAELLPCPFCGGDAEVNKHFKMDLWSLIHRCPAVGAIYFDWGDKARHIDNWNQRASTPPQGADDGVLRDDTALLQILAEESRRVSDASEIATYWLPNFQVGMVSEKVALAAMRRLASTALPGVTVPDGWKLVPTTPTENMLADGFKANLSPPRQSDGSISVMEQTLHIWRAMVRVSPSGPLLPRQPAAPSPLQENT